MPGFAGIVYLSSLKTVTQPDSNALPINQTENIMWNLVDSTGSGSLIPFIGTSVDWVLLKAAPAAPAAPAPINDTYCSGARVVGGLGGGRGVRRGCSDVGLPRAINKRSRPAFYVRQLYQMSQFVSLADRLASSS